MLSIAILIVLAILALAVVVLKPGRRAEGFEIETKPWLYARFAARYTKTVTKGEISEGEDWLSWQIRDGSSKIFEKRPDANIVRAAVMRVARMYEKNGATSFMPLRVDYFIDDSGPYVSRANFIYVRFTSSIGNGEALFFKQHTSSKEKLVLVALSQRSGYLILKDPSPPFPAVAWQGSRP